MAKPSKQSPIGLDKKASEQLVAQLNDLLANYQVFYMNVRGFHWNVKGDNFFELHLKFEEIYNDLLTKVDELAERILTLGYQPDHAYSVYAKKSAIKEAIDVSDGKTCMEKILEAFAIILPKQRELLELASNSGDEGTNSQMSDYIKEQEKTIWMFNAYLGK